MRLARFIGIGTVAATVVAGWSVWSLLKSKDQTTWYEMSVELIYKPTNEKVSIKYPFKCEITVDHNLAWERVTSSKIIPAIFGKENSDGSGIAILTPDICNAGRPLDELIPDDLLPVVFFSPDIQNTTFMVGYLSENAYMQQVSKLTFKSASIKKIQIVDKAQNTGSGYIPEDMLSSKNLLPYRCRYAIPLPIPEKYRSEARAAWTQQERDWWISNQSNNGSYSELARKTIKYWRDRNFDLHQGDDISGYTSVRRRQGGGNIQAGISTSHFGLAPRIPFVATPVGDSSVVVNITTKNGSHAGFAYCQREFTKQNPERYEVHIQIDGQEVASGRFYDGNDWGIGRLTYRDEYVYQPRTWTISR